MQGAATRLKVVVKGKFDMPTPIWFRVDGTPVRLSEMSTAERWTPGASELQRGRAALLAEFRKPHNLPVSEYAKLAGVSRQQIYKDLKAMPPKLLALRVGKGSWRVPDWQLEEHRGELTRLVLDAAPQLDA